MGKYFKLFALAACAACIATTSCKGGAAGTEAAAAGTEAAAAAKDSSKVVIIDFNATWCGPCRRFAPNFQAAEEKYQGRAEFLSIDIDDNPDIARQFDIESIPAIVFITPDGKVSKYVGYMEREQFFALVEDCLR